MSANHKLRIRYGLSKGEPTEEQALRWARRADELIAEGWADDAAGKKAAEETFRTLGSYKYASRPDTVHDLIMELLGKYRRP